MQPSPPRYAIYFTPDPFSPLAQFGASVLGYDACERRDVPHLALRNIQPANIVAVTRAPRKYGFHATLAAPFYLAAEHTEADLLRALDTFSLKGASAVLGKLQVSALGDFIALTPEIAVAASDLAQACVTFFDPFRAQLTLQDLARRESGRLTSRQRSYLARWGYPYVFEDFRFHMTLTGALGPHEKERFHVALSDVFAPLADQPFSVDAISLMRQSGPQARFEVLARKALRRGLQ